MIVQKQDGGWPIRQRRSVTASAHQFHPHVAQLEEALRLERRGCECTARAIAPSRIGKHFCRSGRTTLAVGTNSQAPVAQGRGIRLKTESVPVQDWPGVPTEREPAKGRGSVLTRSSHRLVGWGACPPRSANFARVAQSRGTSSRSWTVQVLGWAKGAHPLRSCREYQISYLAG